MSNKEKVFILLMVVGAVLPGYHFVNFLWNDYPSVSTFFDQLLATSISRFFAWDLAISATAFLVWLAIDAPRKGVRSAGLYVLLCLGVGLSVALPAYLYARERITARQRKKLQ